MLTVTRASRDRDPFYHVDLSEGEALQVSEDVLVYYRLSEGRELDKGTIQKIRKSNGADFGFRLAMNYLSYRLRSEKEIRAYLKEKEILQEDRNKIVARLKELDLVNNLVYGESYMRANMRLGDEGSKRLAQQMQQKGLEPEIIKQTLSQHTFEDQVQNVHQTTERAFEKSHGKNQKELLRKVQQTLMTKGFSREVIQQAVADLPQEIDQKIEYDYLVKQGDKLWRRNLGLEPKKRNLKVKQGLYQKGLDLGMIQRFTTEKGEKNEWRMGETDRQRNKRTPGSVHSMV